MTWSNVNKPTTDDWSEVPKPSESSLLGGTGGVPIGLLMALTYSENNSSISSTWSLVAKPTT